MILAPAVEDAALRVAVTELRGIGERVVYALPGQSGTAADMGCYRVLEKAGDGWVIQAAG